MIAYQVLRMLGQFALRWFYRDVEVVGIERFPTMGPVLLASNHPNALVDALVIGCMLQRPVTLTAKATLLTNPITRALVRAVGVVPLQRASDARSVDVPQSADPNRNANAFARVLDVLEGGGVVLLFPEGKSHNDPTLAPLKTGLARMALMAREDRQIDPLPIVPIGLTFERKWEPRSRVVMYVGEAIVLADHAPDTPTDVQVLTQRVDAALRAVTLNFRSVDDQKQVLSVSTLLAEVLDEFRPLSAPDPPLADRVRLARRINEIADRLPLVDPAVAARIEQFLTRFWAFDEATRQYSIAPNDVQMSIGVWPGAWFVIREALVALFAGPLALWGRVNHWLPVRFARSLAQRTSRSPDDPAMHTIVAGVVLVLGFYAVQAALVGSALGWVVATGYLVTLPLSATWDFRYADRRRRASARVRTYVRFRRDPALQRYLLAELAWLRREALALDVAIDPVSEETRTPAYG